MNDKIKEVIKELQAEREKALDRMKRSTSLGNSAVDLGVKMQAVTTTARDHGAIDAFRFAIGLLEDALD